MTWTRRNFFPWRPRPSPWPSPPTLIVLEELRAGQAGLDSRLGFLSSGVLGGLAEIIRRSRKTSDANDAKADQSSLRREKLH